MPEVDPGAGEINLFKAGAVARHTQSFDETVFLHQLVFDNLPVKGFGRALIDQIPAVEIPILKDRAFRIRSVKNELHPQHHASLKLDVLNHVDLGPNVFDRAYAGEVVRDLRANTLLVEVFSPSYYNPGNRHIALCARGCHLPVSAAGRRETLRIEIHDRRRIFLLEAPTDCAGVVS
jgi:hypothetical protein